MQVCVQAYCTACSALQQSTGKIDPGEKRNKTLNVLPYFLLAYRKSYIKSRLIIRVYLHPQEYLRVTLGVEKTPNQWFLCFSSLDIGLVGQEDKNIFENTYFSQIS